jgi:hypothetical protein
VPGAGSELPTHPRTRRAYRRIGHPRSACGQSNGSRALRRSVSPDTARAKWRSGSSRNPCPMSAPQVDLLENSSTPPAASGTLQARCGALGRSSSGRSPLAALISSPDSAVFDVTDEGFEASPRTRYLERCHRCHRRRSPSSLRPFAFPPRAGALHEDMSTTQRGSSDSLFSTALEITAVVRSVCGAVDGVDDRGSSWCCRRWCL